MYKLSAWTQLNATFNLHNWLIVNTFLNFNLTFGFVFPLTNQPVTNDQINELSI